MELGAVVSLGYSDDDAPWNLGPSNAVRGDDNTVLCAWTDFSYQNPPDIYGDVDS